MTIRSSLEEGYDGSSRRNIPVMQIRREPRCLDITVPDSNQQGDPND